MAAPPRPLWLPAAALLLIALAMLRPIDHDESQYVAAAVLTAHGLLPYRDYAYLQTPLQPFLFAPVAVVAGAWTWAALRLANALLGVAAIGFVHAAARAGGARPGPAFAATALFAATDILLFSVGTARNDALPAACLAAALWLIARGVRDGGTRTGAAAIGALFAAAVAAKLSYALPAAGYGVYALVNRRHRPAWVLAGALPFAALVALMWAIAPQGALFGIFTFPAAAPAQYYLAQGRGWKLTLPAKLLDLVKFLALGAALPALGSVARRMRRPTLFDWLILAGLVAALLPTPTWRQYLLPMLPALFVRLAQVWSAHPPTRRLRIAYVVFACAGLAPSVEAVLAGNTMIAATQAGRAIRVAMDAAGLDGPVATLSPQFLPATGRLPDPRFAAGPFYFRSEGLVPARQEAMLHLVARGTIAAAALPPTVLIGGEGAWTSGDARLDAVLERRAIAAGYRRHPVAGTDFRLYGRP